MVIDANTILLCLIALATAKLLFLVNIANKRGEEMRRTLIYNKYNDTCPNCGCTEMLCGHNGVGCTSEN